jgi:hypothetical protein
MLVPFCNSIRSPAYQGLNRKNQVGMALQLSCGAAFWNAVPHFGTENRVPPPIEPAGMLFLKMF